MVGTVRVNVVVLLFLLIPGLFGMKAFLQAYVKLDDLSRFDKLAVIMTIGGFALVIPPLALNWNCWTGYLQDVLVYPHTLEHGGQSGSNAWCSEAVITFGDVLTTDRLSELPLIIVVLFLGMHTVLVSSISYAVGWSANKWSDGPPREPKYVEQPWEYASNKTVRENDQATVITTDSEEIRGTIHRIGSPSEDYDILLKDPEKVLRDGQTDTEVDTRGLGAYTYHHYRDISRIRFPNLDTYEDYQIDVNDATERFEERIGDHESRSGDDSTPSSDEGTDS